MCIDDNIVKTSKKIKSISTGLLRINSKFIKKGGKDQKSFFPLSIYLTINL